MMVRALLLLVMLISCFGGMLKPVGALADESRPIYIEITQLSDLGYRLGWKIPPVFPPHALPGVRLPEDCVRAGEGDWMFGGLTGGIVFSCVSPLQGRAASITYPILNPSLSTMIRFKALNGEEHFNVLQPDEVSWTIPEAETASGVALQYTVLGIEHIWVGIDHLLFLICLMWIAGGAGRILLTITGFTAAHSVTLILSALDLVRLPVPPVEAAIALSIVFLAREIAVNRRDSLTWRYPLAVSSSFGLLHGLGFAFALADVGLPQTALLTGLLSFNLGVEIGQIIFVAAVGGLLFVGRIALNKLRESRLAPAGESLIAVRLQPFAAYGVGIVATYWFVERVAAFVPNAP